jgi:electron transport complex protein RnfB
MVENRVVRDDMDIYRRLARRLDEIPNGFPATESGAELRLLAELFAPDEAELALELKLTPEPVARIAKRAGADARGLDAKLSGMADRGLIRAKRRKERVAYGLIPFVVGIYELQLDHIDEKLARLFEEYYQEAFHKLLEVKPTMQRVIAVEQNVPVGIGVTPYEIASDLLGEAKSWGVMDCICRKQKKLVGQPCEHPVDVCMIFSRRPGAFDESESIRVLTKQEALDVLRRAEEAGLVHTVENVQRGAFYICNCCTCSCAILRGVAEYGMLGAVSPSGFRAALDERLCTGCELCIERCQFGALSVAENLCSIDEQRCFGCGLCVSACGDGALSLVRRPEDQVPEPPQAVSDWMMDRADARGLDRGRLLELIGRVQRSGG